VAGRLSDRIVGPVRLGGILIALLVLGLLEVGCISFAPPFPEVPAWDDPVRPISELSVEERELWELAEKAIGGAKDEGALVENPEFSAYLAEVVGQIWHQPPPPAPSIQILVVDSAELNAFAWPNGFIMISSGLLAAIENEAQLAYLLGHEIAHILRRHSLEEDRYEAISDSHVDRMLLSKQAESEADRVGFELVAAAEYAPSEAVRMMGHLDNGSEPPVDRIRSWESHADLAERIRAVERVVERSPARGARIEEERYLAAIDPLRLRVVELEIDTDAYEAAKVHVAEHLRREPLSGRAHYLRAEITRRVSAEGRRDAAVRRDYERAIELAPEEADALRALGLLLRGRGERERSAELLARYLEARPDAIDRKLIARYLGREAGVESLDHLDSGPVEGGAEREALTP
jgi:predicted Zn-dependent protease